MTDPYTDEELKAVREIAEGPVTYKTDVAFGAACLRKGRELERVNQASFDYVKRIRQQAFREVLEGERDHWRSLMDTADTEEERDWYEGEWERIQERLKECGDA